MYEIGASSRHMTHCKFINMDYIPASLTFHTYNVLAISIYKVGSNARR
jgi:hypothetical protein